MSLRFENKVVLITGAASGIGRATAELFAREGAAIACSDIDEKGLAETVEQIEKTGARAIGVRCNVADAGDGRDAVERAAQELGGLDVLCNIAGMGNMKHTAEVTEEEWNKILGVNLSGTFFMSQAALPHLLKQEGSSIVNIASLAGLIGQAYCAAYCASKAGVVSLTKVMAVEFVKQGLRVNCICPAAVVTPILAGFGAPDGADTALLSRLGIAPKVTMPEEIAEAVAYLASPAATSINGVALPIDYGTSAG
jgi:meso-butanediol dehydrogenase/(S,S)-butanediol dehydrogenase/diacetyl reductase